MYRDADGEKIRDFLFIYKTTHTHTHKKKHNNTHIYKHTKNLKSIPNSLTYTRRYTGCYG